MYVARPPQDWTDIEDVAFDPQDYDVLLADISSTADTDADALLASVDPNVGGTLAAEDDKDEWFGLEYTLELSTRERRASETHSFSGGEHSKVTYRCIFTARL